jgi:hypothetical protein
MSPGKCSRDDRGRQNEAGASNAQPGPPRAHKANRYGRLGRSRAWDQIRGSDHIEKLLPSDPLPLTDNFSFDERYMGCRSTKTDGT